MGVWIEITIRIQVSIFTPVTPFMGVWIEMLHHMQMSSLTLVTPFMGVWIEMDTEKLLKASERPSLPLWECGLKY